MASKWAEVPLEQLKAQTKSAFAMGPFGSKIKAENFTTEGVPVIKGGNLNSTYLDESNFDFLTQEKADELESAKARRLDIVITHRGTLGQVGLIPEDSRYEEYVVSQSQLKMSFDIGKVDPYFVYYFLKSPLGQSRLLSNVSQVGVPAIAQALTSVRAIEILLPPNRAEQVRISKILRDLDQKIDLNRRINQTLEAMAQAIFKSWFVDFDPVKAKIAAKAALTPALSQREREEMVLRAAMTAISGKTDAELDALPPEHYQQLATAAALFPDEMVDSELGEIPRGWEVKPLGDFLTIRRGGSPRPIQEYMAPSGLPWVKIADATAESSPFLFGTKEFIKESGLKKTVYLKSGSLILTNSATPGLPKFLELNACIHDGWLYFPEKRVFTDQYLYFLFQKIRSELVAQGNGSVFTNLKTDILRAQRVLVPNREVITAFTTLSGSILETIKFSAKEGSCLATLRDTLLPKLLSGELAVSSLDACRDASA